jgi:serine/threonine protein phosphatase PrpC
MAITVNHAAGQIVGGRSLQEDVFRVMDSDGALLLFLADGMGGAAGGLEAAQQAVDAAIAHCSDNAHAPDVLSGAIVAANDAVAELKVSRPELNGAGTTLVIAQVDERGVTWASVGDSPLFLCARNGIRRLNADHSIGSALRALERAPERRRSNVLRSSVSGTPIPLVDISTTSIQLRQGDRILLASDGLLELDQKAIQSCCKRGSPNDAVNSLLEKAKSLGGDNLDNTSVIVVDAPASQPRRWSWTGKR